MPTVAGRRQCCVLKYYSWSSSTTRTRYNCTAVKSKLAMHPPDSFQFSLPTRRFFISDASTFLCVTLPCVFVIFMISGVKHLMLTTAASVTFSAAMSLVLLLLVDRGLFGGPFSVPFPLVTQGFHPKSPIWWRLNPAHLLCQEITATFFRPSGQGCFLACSVFAIGCLLSLSFRFFLASSCCPLRTPPVIPLFHCGGLSLFCLEVVLYNVFLHSVSSWAFFSCSLIYLYVLFPILIGSFPCCTIDHGGQGPATIIVSICDPHQACHDD